MKIYELSHIGQFHVNHNEDYLINSEIGQDKILIAVMDGCSTGTDSHLASTLIGKILRKIAKNRAYQSFVTKENLTISELLKLVFKELFEELAYLNSRLDLKSDELLSTVILGIVNVNEHAAEILAIGDGVINLDGRLTEYEQDNKPDYIGYHLQENFEIWYAKQNQRLSISKFRDLSISTDGIHTFKKFDLNKYRDINEVEIIDFLYNDEIGNENATMLVKKLYNIEREFGLKPSDDLTMIRLIAED